jgi:hypothetical protein
VLGFEYGASHCDLPSLEETIAVVTIQFCSGVAMSGPESAAYSDHAAPKDRLAARANWNHSVAIVASNGDLSECGYDVECKIPSRSSGGTS